MKTNKIAYCGVLTCIALILSYVEYLIPFSFSVPGIKPGLGNAIIIFALFMVNKKGAACINLLRISIMAVLFGNIASFAFSLMGGFLSLIGMIILKKFTGAGIILISVTGAILHNIGQISMAVLLFNTAGIIKLLPLYMIGGIVSGIIVGIISGEIIIKSGDKNDWLY